MNDSQARWEELVEKLREQDYRIAPQRLAILRILADSDGHPSAEHIFSQIKGEFPTTILATVYKTIATLKAMGEGPSGHGGVRREGGYSPHVSKFMM